jgi:RNA polymerase sigma factor (sigma-70 family)
MTDGPPISVLPDRNLIFRAAAQLSGLEYRVLLLSAGHGLSNGEIAALLGLSRRRVERLLARALVKFDRALATWQES